MQKKDLIEFLKPYKIKNVYRKKKSELYRLYKKNINEENDNVTFKKCKKKIIFLPNKIYEFEKYEDIVSSDYKLLENNPDKWESLINDVNSFMNKYNIWDKIEITNFLNNDLEKLELSLSKKITLKKKINKCLKYID